jgi:glycosyltransferase involved in cell wall biosynthesis
MIDLKIAIDATRVKSGGGVAHLLGILNIDDIHRYGIREVHVWSYQELLDRLPTKPWLIKHCPSVTKSSLLRQIYWQAFHLQKEISRSGCHLLFAVDASTFSRFRPMVVLSQNMIPFEVGFEKIYGYDKSGIHQRLILRAQKSAFKFADSVIFLTNYAAARIQRYTGSLRNFRCIAHGVDAIFKQEQHHGNLRSNGQEPMNCLYVSPIWEYKHQAELVRAFKLLNDRGYPAVLTLTGGGNKEGHALLDQELQRSDPQRTFVKVLDFIPHAEVPKLMAHADIFVFASSVETFGITLLEAMTVGMPIACSNRSSLPETLQDGGLYFDPLDVESIAQTLAHLMSNPELRANLSARAKDLAAPYSWQKCADETWTYIVQTYQRVTQTT